MWKHGKFMEMVRIRDWDDYISLPIDKHGIRHPVDGPPHREVIMKQSATLDVIIVPGLAFDQEAHRLGRGKGYYDAYIASYNEYAKENGIPPPILSKFHTDCTSESIY